MEAGANWRRGMTVTREEARQDDKSDDSDEESNTYCERRAIKGVHTNFQNVFFGRNMHVAKKTGGPDR